MEGGPGAPGQEEVLAVLRAAADAVADALGDHGQWHPLDDGAHSGQHASDVVADEAAVSVLVAGGLGVLSEESGLHHADRPVLAVLDPLDGSTNAWRGVPWFCVSVGAFGPDGPLAAVVRNLVDGTEYAARRGRGATRDGQPISPAGTSVVSEAVIGVNGHGPHLGWAQFRALGATALDLCLVADGRLDAYVAMHDDSVPVWDYGAGWLICTEAGATVLDSGGRDLLVRDRDSRRTLVAAATPELAAAMVAARSAVS